MVADAAGQPAALAGQRRHQLPERGLVDVGDDLGERLRQPAPFAPGRAQDIFAGRRHHFLGVAFVEHRKMRRDAGLERESAEQRLAEGVNGLDVQPAGGVEDAGEELPGAHPLSLVRRSPEQIEQIPFEVSIGGRGPFAELPGDPIIHFRRRGLGEGQAEDFLRRRAGEHQA